jgi:hypothetical protein
MIHIKNSFQHDSILEDLLFPIPHSNLKFRVSATEAFRKTTFTEVSSSKILPDTSGF